MKLKTSVLVLAMAMFADHLHAAMTFVSGYVESLKLGVVDSTTPLYAGQPGSYCDSFPYPPGSPTGMFIEDLAWDIEFNTAHPYIIISGEVTPNLPWNISMTITFALDHAYSNRIMPIPTGVLYTNIGGSALTGLEPTAGVTAFPVEGYLQPGTYTISSQGGFWACFGWEIDFAPVIPPTSISVTSNSQLILSWTGLQGYTYLLQYTTNLNQPHWANLGSPITATNTLASVTTPVAPDRQRFYRVQQQ
jgi:hypothetical protein